MSHEEDGPEMEEWASRRPGVRRVAAIALGIAVGLVATAMWLVGYAHWLFGGPGPGW